MCCPMVHYVRGGSNLSFGNTHIHTHTPCSVIPVRALNYLCHDHGECCQASHCSEYIWLHYPTTRGVAPWGDMLPLDSQIFDFIKWRYLTPRGWIRPCVSTIRIIDTWTPLPLKSITIFWILYVGRPKYQHFGRRCRWNSHCSWTISDFAKSEIEGTDCTVLHVEMSEPF